MSKTIERPLASVTVTQQQIDQAIPKNSGHCMIANAVVACFFKKFKRNPKRVQVDLQAIRFSDGCNRFIYLTPPKAQRALLQFDHGIKPEPFTFRLNLNIAN